MAGVEGLSVYFYTDLPVIVEKAKRALLAGVKLLDFAGGLERKRQGVGGPAFGVCWFYFTRSQGVPLNSRSLPLVPAQLLR